MKVQVARESARALNPWLAVAVAVFSGNQDVSHAVYGANRWRDAVRHMTRLRKQGLVASVRWVNVGPWCRELWVQDLARPLGRQPAGFYGALIAAVDRSKAA